MKENGLGYSYFFLSSTIFLELFLKCFYFQKLEMLNLGFLILMKIRYYFGIFS